ncbi:MAG: hypothetical protein SVO26_04335 [Chloroflexota bacterium]|nr:hypothetical protein [Chloroflexota bacterium]
MHITLKVMKGMVNNALERDRQVEGYVDTASRLIWRWQEMWLVILVGVLAILDYTTTFIVLEWSGKDFLQESGLLAGWALQVGGLWWLFLVDMGAVVALSLIALLLRFLCFRFGFYGFGRAAFVALLVPYAIVAAGAIINNSLMAIL